MKLGSGEVETFQDILTFSKPTWVSDLIFSFKKLGNSKLKYAALTMFSKRMTKLCCEKQAKDFVNYILENEPQIIRNKLVFEIANKFTLVIADKVGSLSCTSC